MVRIHRQLCCCQDLVAGHRLEIAKGHMTFCIKPYQYCAAIIYRLNIYTLVLNMPSIKDLRYAPLSLEKAGTCVLKMNASL